MADRTVEDELREQLKHERARNDRMERRLDKIIASITREPKPIAVRKARPPENVEANAVRRAEVKQLERQKAGFLSRATADLVKTRGLDAVAAGREASRLYDEAMAAHPAGG